MYIAKPRINSEFHLERGRSQPQVGLLSTPTVSSVPGEYNYFSAGAKVIITAGASGYCSVKSLTVYHTETSKCMYAHINMTSSMWCSDKQHWTMLWQKLIHQTKLYPEATPHYAHVSKVTPPVRVQHKKKLGFGQ